MQRITVKNTAEQQIGIANAQAQRIGTGNAYTIVIGADPYEGEYVVTPSAFRQILQTKNKRMDENVVVEPIPHNYGLITYNGFELTVS